MFELWARWFSSSRTLGLKTRDLTQYVLLPVSRHCVLPYGIVVKTKMPETY